MSVLGRRDGPLLLRLVPLLRALLLASGAVVALAMWLGPRPREVTTEDLLAALTGTLPSVEDGRDATAPEAAPGLARGVAAPDFELPLFGGGSLRLGDLRGRAVVLNFWASWCPPCRAEAPTFARVAAAYREQGVAFVGVNVQDREADARAFLEEFGIAYPTGPDSTGQIGADYGLTGLPTTVFVDPAGRVARRWLGGLSERQLNGFIEEARR